MEDEDESLIYNNKIVISMRNGVFRLSFRSQIDNIANVHVLFINIATRWLLLLLSAVGMPNVNLLLTIFSKPNKLFMCNVSINLHEENGIERVRLNIFLKVHQVHRVNMLNQLRSSNILIAKDVSAYRWWDWMQPI